MSFRLSQKILYPRSLAVGVLVRVLNEKIPLDEALGEVTQLRPESMAWLQEVCAGTLRWKGRLDYILDAIALKKKPSGWLRKILLIAAYQIVVQERTSVGLVVSETVSEIKRKEGSPPANFANACLRKIAQQALQWKNWPCPLYVSLQPAWGSLPAWLWFKCISQHGFEWTKDYAVSSLERPILWIRDRQEGPRKISSRNDLFTTPDLKPENWIVQDISSQMLVKEVTSELESRRQKKWMNTSLNQPLTALDVCASPGGKAVGLAWNGIKVDATDRTESRLPLLQETVQRVAPQIRIVPWDQVWNTGTYDLIWVDAPCSGSGILRRHPDVRWLRKEQELPDLMQAQRQLLRAAWQRVPAGGFLVYSVCSVLKEEGIEAIQSEGLESFLVKTWFFYPQVAPLGDGFWAGLLYRVIS